jgi:hypothetical protein
VTSELSKVKLQAAVDAIAKYGSAGAAASVLGIAASTLKDQRVAAIRAGIQPTPSTNDELPAALKEKIKRLTAELKQANEVSANATEIKKIIGTLDLKLAQQKAPVWTSKIRKPSSPGVPTLFLSDLHWGERVYPTQIGGVNEFNIPIAKRRLRYTMETAINLLRILDREMDYPGIVIPLGGDMISGNIHDELVATNELGSIPAMLDLHGDLTALIRQAADVFGNVFLPCVSGNHGRDTRKIWAKDRHHTSFDWLLYQFLAKTFDGDKRVNFYIPDSSDALYRIYDYRYLLTHGDQFRGGDGVIGALGPIIRGDQKKRARNAQVDQDYDTLICGHWHQLIMLRRLIVNGSLKGMDEYAYQGNFPFEDPTQGLWVTHPRYGITYRMPVYCEQHPAPKSTSWVSIPEGK